MLGFIDWLHEEVLKKKRKKNGEQHSNQGSGKIGDVDNQRQIDRFNQEIFPPVIHYFPEP